MSERLIKPKETICLLLYGHPRNVEDICKTLYGKKRNARVSGWLTELVKEGWIEEVPNLDDRRYKYYQTTAKSIFDSIINDLERRGVKLQSDEKKRLFRFLKSKPFKEFVCDNLKYIDLKKEQYGFDIVKRQLCYLCAFHSFLLEYTIKTDSDLEYLLDLKFDIEKDITNQLPDDVLDEYIVAMVKKAKDTLNTRLTELGVHLLRKLTNLDIPATKIIQSYISRIITSYRWFPVG